MNNPSVISMEIKARIKCFSELGSMILNKIEENDATLTSIITDARNYNHWHIHEFVRLRLEKLSNWLSDAQNLDQLAEKLNPTQILSEKNIGISSDERIPLQDFSTIIACLLAGYKVIYQIHEKSDKLLIYFFNLHEKLSDLISFSQGPLRNTNMDIINQPLRLENLASNYSNKSNRLVLKRTTSVAVLTGSEKADELDALSDKVFLYFGMNTHCCKKIFIPEGFSFDRLFKAFEKYSYLGQHHQYANNYQYHQSVYLMNRIKFDDIGFLLLHNSSDLFAPTAVLYFEYYTDYSVILNLLEEDERIETIYTDNTSTNKIRPIIESDSAVLMVADNIISFLAKRI